MATIDDKKFIDNVIANNGFYNGDDEDSPDNPRIIKIVEYTNMAGKITWAIISEREKNPNRYAISEFVRNLKTIWEYKS